MKTVKNFFEKSLAVLLMVLGAVSFASCGDDDDDATEPTVTVQKVEVYVDFEPTQDMLDYCKMTLVYSDASGEKSMLNVTGLSTKGRLATITKLPMTGKVELFCEPKEGVSFPANKTLFKYKHSYTVSGVAYYSNGKSEKTGFKNATNNDPLQCPIDQMDRWYSEYGQHTLHSFTIDAEGNFK